MRILLTNDDGIHAPGLNVLEEIARTLSDDVTIVAPLHEQSGAAHALSLNDPLRLRHVGEKRYGLKGTPTDCVIFGVRHLMRDNPPDLVLSGVNIGQNIAEDITYSGTVAGAIEGALLGIPSMALSQAYHRTGRDQTPWECARQHGPEIVRKILQKGIAPGLLININFPGCEADAVEGVCVTSQGRRGSELLQIEERRDGRGIAYYWLTFARDKFGKTAGTDVEAMAGNRISVTPLHIDMTHRESLAGYAEIFA